MRVTAVPPSGGPVFGVRLEMKKVGSVLQVVPDPLPRYVKACRSVAEFSETRPMSRRTETSHVSEIAGFASTCRGVVTVICWSACAVICADAPQNVTCVVAMFVPKWPPKIWTTSPPAEHPEVGRIDERNTCRPGGMHAKVNWNGGDVNPFTTTTTFTVSGTAEFFSGGGGGVKVICVFVTEPLTEPLTPPKKTSAVPVPKRPPRIVTVSPPAHEPVVGVSDEMNGPVSGTPPNCRRSEENTSEIQ